ncbi:hypothetical protein Fmac_022311 [Flemingia macrophylla]|uniref:Uncharacterized protein n=1 Tax=Flemingia macrophylla TaxID=520843 RepID=A0ABD1LZD4_9FABA
MYFALMFGYAQPNSDRREGVLRRKCLEYLDCVSQNSDIPDTERSDDDVNMLRQSADINWPASGYVQGINDLVTLFLVVFLSEYLEGGIVVGQQPGLQHVGDQGLEFLQFAFRGFNCLLVREVPFDILLSYKWDTVLKNMYIIHNMSEYKHWSVISFGTHILLKEMPCQTS